MAHSAAVPGEPLGQGYHRLRCCVSTEQVVSAARTTALYSLGSACGMGTCQQPCGIVSSGWKEDCSCLVMVWLLSTAFRPEEVLCPMICLFSSLSLQAPWAAQEAGALPSGHKSLVTHCQAGGECQVGFITCVLNV